MESKRQVVVTNRALSLMLFGAIGILLFMHILGTAWSIHNDFEVDRFTWFFDFGLENNLPALFSFSLLFLSGLVLTLIAHATRSAGERFAGHWLVLGLVFVFLALDESLQIHEAVGDALQGKFDTKGILYFAWVAPYAVAVAALGLIYIPFFRDLDSRTRNGFFMAAAVYLTGPVGMELIEGAIAESCGEPCWPFVFLVTIEETMEMLGVALFIRAQIAYLGDPQRKLSFVFQ